MRSILLALMIPLSLLHHLGYSEIWNRHSRCITLTSVSAVFIFSIILKSTVSIGYFDLGLNTCKADDFPIKFLGVKCLCKAVHIKMVISPLYLFGVSF